MGNFYSRRFPALDVLRPHVNAEVQENAVRALVGRILPRLLDKIELVVNASIESSFQKDKVILENSLTDGKVLKLTGTSGVAVAWGLQSYLRKFCNCHFSWNEIQVETVPETLPKLEQKIILQSVGRIRHASNVCTFGYSYLFWDWTRWEKYIDWMALQGINLPLADVGQESVWQEVWREFKLTDEEISNFFTGAPFLAWQRMGNLKQWGGPLSQKWIDKQRILQQKIVRRMVEFGMTPVLPGFAGHVPDAFKLHYPNASITPGSDWGRFGKNYSKVDFLDPMDPLFKAVGNKLLEKLQKAFGIYHAYLADPFNEMKAKSYDESYMKNVSMAIFEAMNGYDPKAIWVMQGWMFVHDSLWQMTDGAKGLLKAPPSGRILILDLYAEQIPAYKMFHSFYGQPFVWNMLHNFGGKLGLQGAQHKVNQGVTAALSYKNSTMVGTGITMEGIFQNYAIYQFMIDRGWSFAELDDKWPATFADQRYGQKDDELRNAWQLLWASVYTDGIDDIFIHSGHIELKRPRSDKTILFKTPSLHYNALELWYDAKILCGVWKIFVFRSVEHSSSLLFRQDLVDITREMLQIIGANHFYKEIVKAYNQSNAEILEQVGNELLTLFDDLDKVLATHPHFLLGPWIKDGRAKAVGLEEQNKLEYLFRNQLTLWGPDGNIKDYARKQWSGLIRPYYRARWQLFIDLLKDSLAHGTKFHQDSFRERCFKEIEEPFTLLRCTDPSEPVGDSVTEAKRIYEKYFNVCQKL